MEISCKKDAGRKYKKNMGNDGGDIGGNRWAKVLLGGGTLEGERWRGCCSAGGNRWSAARPIGCGAFAP